MNNSKHFVERTENIISKANITTGDTVAILFGFGPYTLAHHLFEACRNMDISVWPIGNPKYMDRNLLSDYLNEVKPTVLACLPTTLYGLIREKVLNKEIRKVLAAGEYISKSGMEWITGNLHAEIFDHLGSTEIPSMTYTCVSGSREYHLNRGVEVQESGNEIILLDKVSGIFEKNLKSEIVMHNSPCPYCSYPGPSLLIRDRIFYNLANEKIGNSELCDLLNKNSIFEYSYDQNDHTLLIQENYKSFVTDEIQKMFERIKFLAEIPTLRSGKTRLS